MQNKTENTRMLQNEAVKSKAKATSSRYEIGFSG